ncbi:MAG: heavy metal translocating P-type ATPase [Aquabacterium sp.]
MSDQSPRRPVIPISATPAQTADSGCCDDGHGHDRHDHGHAHGDQEDACCGPASHAAQLAPVATPAPPPDSAKVRFRIDKMDCPTEERLIRNRLEPMPGVVRLDFNLLARELTVFHQLEDTEPLAAALNAIDMAPTLLEAGQVAAALPPAVSARTKRLLAVSGAAAVGAEVAAWASGQEASWPVMALAALSIATAGLPTLKKGWIALRHLTLNIYFLMSLALIGAVAIGKWSEAAMVVFLFALAEAIEALSLERARHAVQSLSALAPDTADIFVDGQWQSTHVDQVAVGSRMRLRTGDRVALDARVAQGHAALDQAPITGESMPVDKQVGDSLYAGSIVTDGVLEAEVTATAGHSTLAQIAHAIQEAQSQRAPTQRFVDEFARYYTPAVVLLAMAVAVGGPLLMGGASTGWLYQALVMLVIACPCALVVSTPVTVVSGLAAAARQGILVKGGRFLEGGRLLRAIALDKTGTLTQGRAVLTDVQAFCGLTQEEVLQHAASLDTHSRHPVAQAVVKGWRQRAPSMDLLPATQFVVLPGLGVQGVLDGALWQLGNAALAEQSGTLPGNLQASLNALAGQGKSVVLLVQSGVVVGVLAVADAVRPQSAPAVRALRQLAVQSVMLTGDNAQAASFVAQQVGIDEVKAGLLPAQKLDAIVALKQRHGHVGMVGDGINDAPALARADIGFAMGAAGTATALEAADVAIMDDDPGKLARFIALSHRTSRVLKQNIALALGIKLVFLILAFAGKATLWMAVFADMGASLLVVFNGLRLLRSR